MILDPALDKASTSDSSTTFHLLLVYYRWYIKYNYNNSNSSQTTVLNDHLNLVNKQPRHEEDMNVKLDLA